MSGRVTRIRTFIGKGVVGRRACEYALRTLLEMVVSPDRIVSGIGGASLQEDEIAVTYGGGFEVVEGGIHLFGSGFFDHVGGSEGMMPKRPVVRLEGIPALYRDERQSPDRFFSVEHASRGTRVECHVDIVAGAFFMLSRYEETVVRSADRFQRFAAEDSLAVQEGFLGEPLVNQYAEKLLDMLRLLGFAEERRRWWKDAPWAIALTHDIDKLHRFPMSALDLVRYAAGRVPEGAPGPQGLLQDWVRTVSHRKHDEYDCLVAMATMEEKMGIHASYYFLGDARGLHAADYVVNAPGVAASMREVAALGHEIGFHAGFWSYDSSQRFHRELLKVKSSGMDIVGGRQHYLRWRTPATWRLWEGEGLLYDASLGYSKTAGFRCGTCLPFHPYDIEQDREMSIWEWPLMFMDDTYATAWTDGAGVLEHLAGECSRYGGVLVLLWHNIYWSPRYAPAIRGSLEALLERMHLLGVTINSIQGLMPPGRPG